MIQRLLPTGVCWCGCGDEPERGSFFKPGHDRKAEGRLINTVFGGIPQFLKAFGFEPGGSEEHSLPGIDSARRLAKYAEVSAFILEYTDRTTPWGELHRTPGFNMLTRAVDLSSGAIVVTLGGASLNAMKECVAVPIVDLLTVYREGDTPIARVSGFIDEENGKYIGLGRACPCVRMQADSKS